MHKGSNLVDIQLHLGKICQERNSDVTEVFILLWRSSINITEKRYEHEKLPCALSTTTFRIDENN